MDEVSTNPLIVPLFFIIRCLVPLIILLGISYLLKRLGVIAESPKPPEGWNNNNNHSNGEEKAAHV